MNTHDCTECEGHGYFQSYSDRYGYQIERCDLCEEYADDSAAAVRFVEELEQGDAWALDQVAQLLLSPETWEYVRMTREKVLKAQEVLDAS